MTEQEAIEVELIERELSNRTQQPQPQSVSIERQNIFGQVGNVPGAAIRSSIRGKGYAKGAMFPSKVPTFQNELLDEYYKDTINKKGKIAPIDVIGGNVISTVGLAMDTVTSPIDLLGMLVGYGASKIGKVRNAVTAPRSLKVDRTLTQSAKSKVALDGVRKTMGKAKDLAIQEIADVPTELVGFKSPKAIEAIKNPIYEVEFTQDGTIKQTIGNFDKVKEAVGDLIGSKPTAWLEAPKKEKQLIMKSYFDVRNAMVSASQKVGKDISGVMDNYHKFMLNYNKVKRTITDAQGQAVANKLKNAFKWKAEPAIREAWKEVSKASPEIKRIMTSQRNRRLLKNLLWTAGAGAGFGLAGKGISLIKD